MIQKYAAILSLLVVPVIAHGDVRINEIAWMGTTESANDEWIELYNDSDVSIDLTGWVLKAIDDSPRIELVGTISPHDFFLLERTDDGTVPRVTADVLFTGSLANSGEVLVLQDDGGVEVDRVNGSDTWSIGGNNETKDTLSYSGGTCITAVPTPGKENSTSQTAISNSSNNTSSKSSSKKLPGKVRYGTPDTTKKIQLVSKPKELFIDLGEDKVVTTQSVVPFHVDVFDQNGKEIKNATVVWNLGDGTVKKGREVEHIYQYGGEYVVSATVTYQRFDNPQTRIEQLFVTVQEAHVRVSAATRDYIELNNPDEYDVDISDWKLLVGSSYFRLPQGTTLQANSSLKFPRTTTMLAPTTKSQVTLFYPSGEMVKETPRVAVASALSEAHALPPPQATIEPSPQQTQDPVVAIPRHLLTQHKESAEDYSPQHAAAAGAINTNTPLHASSGVLWFLALFGVISAASTLVLLGRSQEPKVATIPQDETSTRAEEFTFIEDELPQKNTSH